MLIFILAYLGGVLTIFSPCVLPVLPFIFARSDRSFRRSGLPILLGMAATFTVLASLAAVGGAWLIALNQYGRYAAMLLLLLLGLALIFPALSDRLMRPFVAFVRTFATTRRPAGQRQRLACCWVSQSDFYGLPVPGRFWAWYWQERH